jgi:hypothetical protein
VVNGLKLPRFTEPVEGTVRKVKLIKRHGTAGIRSVTTAARHQRGLTNPPLRYFSPVSTTTVRHRMPTAKLLRSAQRAGRIQFTGYTRQDSSFPLSA